MFNPELTDGEVERLALLAEECGEVVQIIGKILRHGYESYHPNDEKRTSNRSLLERESGHVLAALHILNDYGEVDQAGVEVERDEKLTRVQKYLHHTKISQPTTEQGGE